VHVLVAEAFLGPKPTPTYEVNHVVDGDKQNNRSWNLEWATHGGNIRHAFRKGLAKGLAGERNNAAKLTWESADRIRSLRASGASVAELAERFGVHDNTIRELLAGRTWRRKPATLSSASALADLSVTLTA
jgi:lambda repressor-like predicted transcriptional regulator